jgi:signal transduction histidine kinase
MMARMATVSGASLDGVSAAASGRHNRVRSAAIAGGLVLLLAYAVLPGRFVFVREELLYVLGELLTVAAIVVGVRWYRPAVREAWLLIAGGIAFWVVGDAVWGYYAVVGDDPFPSVADAFYLTGYVALAAGLLIAARARFVERDLGAVLDALVLLLCVGLLLWVYVIDPLRQASDVTLFETFVSISYPLADLLLLAVAARFIVGHGLRTPVFVWLTGAIVLTLVGDTWLTLIDLGSAAADERYANTIVLAGAMCFGAAALDPSMPELTRRLDVAGRTPGSMRLLLIAAATLVPTAVRFAQGTEVVWHLAVILVVTTALLFAAALTRWSGVVNELRRTVARESTLRQYGTELLETSGRAELTGLAERAAQRLLHTGTAELRDTSEPTEDGHPHRVAAGIVVRGEQVGELVATGSSAEIWRVRDAFPQVANELSLALERELLLEQERETAQQLAEQNERLLELDRMKDQFVSTVSHELRTPLASMIGYLEVTLDGEVGELNDEQRAFLEIVNRNCMRLNRLIDDILFMSRFESGRLTLEPSWVSFAELAAESAETARFAAEKRGIEVRCSVEDGLPSYWGDPTRLTQMLDNLISNAIKFTDAGGTVRIDVSRHGDTVRAEIADSGVGIPEDEVGRLFERFFRASTGSSRPGTGLGLSIVQSIAQLHGGSVSVGSEPGVGTTFTIDLPLPGLPDAPAPEPQEVST